MNAFQILVATSNADQRGDLRAAMEFEGYHVTKAVTAGQAVQKASAGHYHALIMDSTVVGVGAHGMCRAIRSQFPERRGECESSSVFVNKLGKKIEPDPGHARYVLTEPWRGYRFDGRGFDIPESAINKNPL